MKTRTVLATAVGIGVGYVLGTRAGRARFDELKAQAQRIVTDPDVRQKVADLPNTVRENLPKAQAAVSDAIKTATDKVHSATSDSDTADSATPSYTATTDPATTGPTTTTDPMTTADPTTTADPATTSDSKPENLS
jgi:hypothetical protein